MLTQLYPVQKTWWHSSIVLRRVCWMSCRFLMVQLQAGQILTACEEGHKFSKRSTKSDQLSCPVHFLFSSTDNYNCYLVRPCKLSHFLWDIPIALHQIHHCWIRDVTGCIPSCSLSVYGPTVHKFMQSFLDLPVVSVSMISCGSKFHQTDMRYSVFFHERDSWACLSDFLSRKFWFLHPVRFKIIALKRVELWVEFPFCLSICTYLHFLLATSGTAQR